MFAVIKGDSITFRSTILSRAEAYRDEHGGILNELVYRDAVEPDAADRFWILQRGQRIATFAELGPAIDFTRANPGCELCNRLLSPAGPNPVPAAA